MSDAWLPQEVEAAVAEYFRMLGMELRGEAYNKAEHNRRLQQLLPRRPRGSIERKHQNISAILIELGYPYISGYKPLANYQRLLRSAVERCLTGATELERAVENSVSLEVEAVPKVHDVLAIQVEPPLRDRNEGRLRDHKLPATGVAKRDYLQIEAANRSLGCAGEELVLRFEHERLWRAGKRSLADRIEHVSRTQGDHLGYDIQSFETDGRNRFIEVKTTRFGALTPFFASRNEVAVSMARDREYHLYRLFKFQENPKLFVLCGSLRYTCELEPANYIARPN